MEKVATEYFSVPVAEEVKMYDGHFISAELAKAAYAPGESIRMIVEVETWTSARWVDIAWGSLIIAYDSSGLELTRVAASHMAVPGVDDRETYDVDLDLGPQPAEGLSGYLELWCEGSPAVKVAEAQFSVPIGEEEEAEEEEEEPAVGNWVPWAIGAGALALVTVAAAATKKG